MIEEFIYEGWMGQEAQKFFEGNCIREERDGCATVGSFIRLSNGKTHLPTKVWRDNTDTKNKTINRIIMDYKEIKLKDHDLSISNNELTMIVDIEVVINQFTADEIVDNLYNIEELYKILKKDFEG